LAFLSETLPSVRGIEAFEAYRNEMVFEPASPSCYSSKPFAASAPQSRGGIDTHADDVSPGCFENIGTLWRRI
jgi:hypothetical protein